MDEGRAIAYPVLEEGVPVYSCDGELIGTVEHVLAAEALDIFHGITVRIEASCRFVAADQIASLHEHGVNLRIDGAAATALPVQEGTAPAWHVREPGVGPGRWRRFLDKLEGGAPTERNWTKDG